MGFACAPVTIQNTRPLAALHAAKVFSSEIRDLFEVGGYPSRLTSRRTVRCTAADPIHYTVLKSEICLKLVVTPLA